MFTNHPPRSIFKPALNSRWILLCFIILTLITRLAAGLLDKGAADFNSDYAAIARNMVNKTGYSLGGGQPSAWRTPGYPLILAGMMSLFGETKLPLVILASLIAALNSFLCYWLGKKIFSRNVGLIASFLYAIIPYLAQKEAITETAFVVLGLLLGLIFIWKGQDSKQLGWFLLSGLALAGAYLVRPAIGLIPVYLAVCLLAAIVKNRKPLMYTLAALALTISFIAGISPWAIRNRIVFKRWYFGQTNFWCNVFYGNHARTFELYPLYSLDSFPFTVTSKYMPVFADEFQRESWLKKEALKQIRALGWKTILIMDCKKILCFWGVRMVPYTDRVGNNPADGYPTDTKRSLKKNLLFAIPYLFLIIFASIGVWQERQRPWLVFFTAGLLFVFSVPYVLTLVYSRYSVPIYFVLILFAARGIAGLLRYLTQKEEKLTEYRA